MDATARDSNLIQPADTQGLDDLFVEAGREMPAPDRTCPDRPPTPADWWTLAEATAALNVNERTLRRWIKQGKIQARKVQGAWGEEWRIMPGHVRSAADIEPGSDMSTVDLVCPDRPPTPDYLQKQYVELRTRLEIIEEQNAELKNQLQGATYRNGYLEAQLEEERHQVKLLTDSKHKPGWWSRFSTWFMGKQIWCIYFAYPENWASA